MFSLFKFVCFKLFYNITVQKIKDDLKAKGMIKYTDMFYSSDMLRHEDEQQYRTVTGGLFSIAIIITTMIGFANMILETLDRSTITTSTEMIKNQDPSFSTFTSSPHQKFMFAVQIWLVSVTGPQRYFNIYFSQEIRSGQTLINKTYLPLQPCTKQHWSSMPYLENKFNMLNIGNWLCPPIGQNFQLYGKYSSDVYSRYIFQVTNCKNQTDPSRPCAPQQKIDELFQTFKQYFYFTLYYTNPIINPSQKDYKKYYLQDENYVIFGQGIGSQAFVYFTDYTIKTDESIWPFESTVYDKGLLVQDLAINHPYEVGKGGNYAMIAFAKSTNSIVYTRQVQKISSVFSFIGGMIGAASAVLFFIKAYTNFAFQISIAFSIFKPQKDSKETLDPKPPINFITFIQLYLYRICSRIGVRLRWAKIHYVSECQEEIGMQLDIKSLVKRFIFIEHCLTNIFEDYQIDGLQINIPTSVKSIKAIRQKCVSIIDEEEEEIKSQVNFEQTNKNNQQNNQNISVEPQVSLQSNLNLRKCQKSRFSKEPNFVVQDFKSQKIQFGVSKLQKKKVVFNLNSINNDYKKDRIRKNNLHLLSMNSRMGNEISRKIWDSLSKRRQIKLKYSQNQLILADYFLKIPNDFYEQL